MSLRAAASAMLVNSGAVRNKKYFLLKPTIRRPCARRDPYRVISRWGVLVDACGDKLGPVVMGPCFRRDDTGFESLSVSRAVRSQKVFSAEANHPSSLRTQGPIPRDLAMGRPGWRLLG